MTMLMTSHRKPSASTAAVDLAAWRIQLWVRWATSPSVGWVPWKGPGPRAATRNFVTYQHRSKRAVPPTPGKLSNRAYSIYRSGVVFVN